MFQINFVVKTVVHPDQTIKIVGNISPLGQWQPEKGLTLERDGEEWNTPSFIEIPVGKMFQFKLIKVHKNGSIEWETLPNNANRKHKPQHHTLIILQWSKSVGKVKNMSISSYMIRGFPGVMIRKKPNSKIMSKKAFDPDEQARIQDSENSSDGQDDFKSIISCKKSDIRASINVDDINEMYYDTTPVENMFGTFRKTKIFLICSEEDEKQDFYRKVEKQVALLSGSDDLLFKWVIQSDLTSKVMSKKSKTRKVSFKIISKKQIFSEQLYSKWKIENYIDADKNTFFIFLNLNMALSTELSSHTKACIYLPSHQYERVEENFQQLRGYKFICFDSVEKNNLLYDFLTEKRYSQIDESDADLRVQNFYEKNIEEVSLEGIIEEIKFSFYPSKKINTVHNFTKAQAKTIILEENSVLIIESSLLHSDPLLFESLVEDKCPKRFIIIYHKEEVQNCEKLEKYAKYKNISIVLENFQKFIYLDKVYEPLRRHNEIMELIKMKAKMSEELTESSWSISESEFVFRADQKVTNKLTKEFQSLINNQNYFKITNKGQKLKITWNLAYRIRLIRTLCRIKYLEEGKIGNFYLVSNETSFQELKEELKLLVNLRYPFLVNEQRTKVMDFAYSDSVMAKFSIQDVEVEK